MPLATWEFEEEYLPGQSTIYNDEDISYNEDKIDGIDVLYNTIGTTTSWTLDDK